MGYQHRYCGVENVVVKYPRKSIEKGAAKRRKEWVDKVKENPELQKKYDIETGKHK